MTVLNEFGQIIGDPVDWKPALFPSRLTSLEGENVLLEVVDVAKHGTDLYDALSYDTNGESWTYLPYGPFETVEAFNLGLSHISSLSDTVTYVIIDKKSEDRKPLGTCSYLRINPEHGSIEVGHLHYSKLVKQSTVTTEAMYLMMKHAFENLHYRRYEWKCNSLNKPSCDAAVRLGLLCEGDPQF